MSNKIREALAGMLAIVDESRGVDGYHLSGDIAEWDTFPEVAAARAALAQQPAPAVPEDLRARCAEILAWQKTGVLKGDALRGYARAQWYADEHNSLQMAEADTARQAYAFLVATPPSSAQEPVPVYLVLAEEDYEAPIVLRAFSDKGAAEGFAQALRDYQQDRPEWPVGDADLEEIQESDEKTRSWMAAHPGGEDAAWRRFFSVLLVPFSAATPAAEQPEQRLDKPARVGATRFQAGVPARLVIEAAHRQYEHDVTPENEAERITKADAFRSALMNTEQPKCITCRDSGIVGHSNVCPVCAGTWTPAAEQPHSTTSDKIRAELYDERPDTVKVPRELLACAARSCANGWVDYPTAKELRALLGKESEDHE